MFLIDFPGFPLIKAFKFVLYLNWFYYNIKDGIPNNKQKKNTNILDLL